MMADSSDEEICSDNEEIDLEHLWHDYPFIRSEEVECPNRFSIIDEDYSRPREIELLPITANGELEHEDEIENLINEINNMIRMVSNGGINSDPQSSDYAYRLQVARQRIINFGNSSVIYDEPQAPSSNKNVSQGWPFSKSKLNPLPEDTVQDRYKQAQKGADVSAPTWFSRRKPGPLLTSRSHNLAKSKFKDASMFVLPTAIERREKREPEKKTILPADKAIFVSNLILSSLVKTTEFRPLTKSEIFKKTLNGNNKRLVRNQENPSLK